MTQINLPVMVSPTPGATLVNNLENWRDALHSMHSGVTRPDYVVPQMMWIDTSETPWVLKVFQGSDDIVLGSLDPSTLVFSSSGGNASGIVTDNSNGLTDTNLQGNLNQLASRTDGGTSVGDLVKLESVGGFASLPAVDGSQLTGISSSTPWMSYTPVFTAFGTVTNVNMFSRRVGDTLEVMGSFQAGSGAGDCSFSLGHNGVEGGLEVSSTKFPDAISHVGTAVRNISAGTYFGAYTIAERAATSIKFSVQTSSVSGLTPVSGTSFGSVRISVRASVPIQGW